MTAQTRCDDQSGDRRREHGHDQHGHVERLVDAALLVHGPAAQLCPDGGRRTAEARHAAKHAADEADGGVGQASAARHDGRAAHEGNPAAIGNQQQSDAKLQRLHGDALQQSGADRHAYHARGKERPETRPHRATPDPGQGLHMSAHGAERRQRRGGRRRHGMQPEAQRDQRIARTGQAIHESRRQCPRYNDSDVDKGREVHAISSR